MNDKPNPFYPQTPAEAGDKFLEANRNRLPKLYEDITGDDVVAMLKLMVDPLQAIHTVVSKSQLQKLCTQLLFQNLQLQKKLAQVNN